MAVKTTAAVEDYVKAIFALEASSGDGEPVSTTAIAERLSVSAASATNMLKRLDTMRLVDYSRYRGAGLTDSGRKVALEVLRHHRLIETYLAEALGVPWDRVHEEAEVLEHVLSEDLEDRMAALLGDPTFDPHGHPIPAKDGSMPKAAQGRLWDVDEGDEGRIARVSDSESEALRYLAELGMKPGQVVSVVGRGPMGGPLFVRVSDGNEVHALSRELAEVVWVE